MKTQILIGFLLFVFGAAITPLAISQQSPEVVRDASGGAASGWSEQERCFAVGQCGFAIVNLVTDEVAVFEDVISNGFVATGNGQEVVRVTELSPRDFMELEDDPFLDE